MLVSFAKGSVNMFSFVALLEVVGCWLVLLLGVADFSTRPTIDLFTDDEVLINTLDIYDYFLLLYI